MRLQKSLPILIFQKNFLSLFLFSDKFFVLFSLELCDKIFVVVKFLKLKIDLPVIIFDRPLDILKGKIFPPNYLDEFGKTKFFGNLGVSGRKIFAKK